MEYILNLGISDLHCIYLSWTDSFTQFTSYTSLFPRGVPPQGMLATESRTQWAFLKWIIYCGRLFENHASNNWQTCNVENVHVHVHQYMWKIQGLHLQCLLNIHVYRNDPKFSDIYAWANSADPDQTAHRGAVWSGSTLFAIPSAFFGSITLRKSHLWVSEYLGNLRYLELQRFY